LTTQVLQARNIVISASDDYASWIWTIWQNAEAAFGQVHSINQRVPDELDAQGVDEILVCYIFSGVSNPLKPNWIFGI
jgi:hypothetical protein